MLSKRISFMQAAVFLGLGIALGLWMARRQPGRAVQQGLVTSARAAENGAGGVKYSNGTTRLHLLQSPAAKASGREENDYELGENYYKKLKPYPPGGPGTRTPLDLWRYAGRGENSWGSPVLPVSWDKWVEMCQEQKPKLMTEVRAYMAGRYNLTGEKLPGAKMSAG